MFLFFHYHNHSLLATVQSSLLPPWLSLSLFLNGHLELVWRPRAGTEVFHSNPFGTASPFLHWNVLRSQPLLLPPPGFSREVFGLSLVSLGSFFQLRSVEQPQPSLASLAGVTGKLQEGLQLLHPEQLCSQIAGRKPKAKRRIS